MKLCLILLFPLLQTAFFSSPLAAAEAGRYGGQLVLPASSDPRSFNPILAKETSTTAITGIIFEGLTRTNGLTTEVEPALAKSWSVDESGLVWEFDLRRDVFWSDGERFTADDVVWTFNRLIYNPAIPSSARDIFTLSGERIKVEKADDHRVRFILPRRFAPFLRAMSQEILPRHILAPIVAAGRFNFAWGTDTPPGDIVGTGPFFLKEYIPGERVVLQRNPLYYRRDKQGQRLPYLEKVVFVVTGGREGALLRFLDGQVDYYALGGRDYPLLKPREARGNFTIYNTGPALGSNFLVFNQNSGVNPQTGRPYLDKKKLRWFSDYEFRRAIARAIDKKAMVEILMNGFGRGQHSALSPSCGFFYNPNVRVYGYDLARAGDILSRAGYVDRDGDGLREDGEGNTLEFTLYTNSQSSERAQIAAIIKNDLARLGIKVNLLNLEFNDLVRRLTATYEWEAMVIGLTGGIEPHFGKNVWYSAGSLHMWYPRQQAPVTDWEREIDGIFDAAAGEMNAKRRKALYDRWQEIVAERLPVIYTVLSDAMFAVRNKFGNLKPTSFGGAFHNLEEIYIERKRARALERQ
ncbi:MAG: ABC transporter substrate-binding protein [Candidatus Omnitrophota bacterium]